MSTHAMCGVLGLARVLAVVVVIMVMIQHEMVAHSWTVITKNTMEHSRAAHAGGQGWSAIWSSSQPLRAAGLGPSWARSSTNLKVLLGPNETRASQADSGANGSGSDVCGLWLTHQGRAGQMHGVPGPRPSWARPSTNPMALLDANEQWHPRVGSDADGGGAGGSGAGSSGTAGRCTVGCGAADNDTVDSEAVSDAAESSKKAARERQESVRIVSGLAATGLAATWSAAAALTHAGLSAAALTHAGLAAAWSACCRRATHAGLAAACSALAAAWVETAWVAAARLVAAGMAAVAWVAAAAWVEAAWVAAARLVAAGMAVAGLKVIRGSRRHPEDSSELRAGAVEGNNTGQRQQALAAQRKRQRVAQMKQRLTTQREQLTRTQGQHRRSRCVGHAFCARAVVVEDVGSERFLRSDGSNSDSDITIRREVQPPILASGTATGYKGVNHDKVRGVFRAVTTEKGRKRRLGDFPTAN